MAENELTLLRRLAGWFESQGASVRSTSFTYDEDRQEAVVSATIDLERTEVIPEQGCKEMGNLLTRANAAMRLGRPSLPTTLELLAHNMAKSILELRRLSRRRGPEYYFDLLAEVDRMKEEKNE